MEAAVILNYENRLPFLYYWTDPHQIWRGCWDLNMERHCYKKLHIHQQSRWRPPPSWLSKIGCHFSTIEPHQNATVTLELLIYQNSSWRPPPSCILKIGCYFYTVGHIITKFDGNVDSLSKKTQLPHQKYLDLIIAIFFEYNDLLLEKIVANSLKLKMAAAAILNLKNL